MNAISVFFSWVWEFVKIALPLFGGFWLGIIAERVRRKDLHLSDFAAAIRTEIALLNAEKSDTKYLEWHEDSVRRLEQYSVYMKDFDSKRWAKIKSSYEGYSKPDIDKHEEVFLLRARGKLIEALNNLLHSVRNA